MGFRDSNECLLVFHLESLIIRSTRCSERVFHALSASKVSECDDDDAGEREGKGGGEVKGMRME